MVTLAAAPVTTTVMTRLKVTTLIVGFTVGLMVGFGVGFTVGEGVGFTVGFGVGFTVGEGVGVGVGFTTGGAITSIVNVLLIDAKSAVPTWVAVIVALPTPRIWITESTIVTTAALEEA